MRNLGCVLLASTLTVGPWLACAFVSLVPPRVVGLGVWPSGGALVFSLSSLSVIIFLVQLGGGVVSVSVFHDGVSSNVSCHFIF